MGEKMRCKKWKEEMDECCSKEACKKKCTINSYPAFTILVLLFLVSSVSIAVVPFDIDLFNQYGVISLLQNYGYTLVWWCAGVGGCFVFPMMFGLSKRIIGYKLLLINEGILFCCVFGNLTACIFMIGEPSKVTLVPYFNSTYGVDGKVPQFLELMQTEFKCCGINGVSDYYRKQDHPRFPSSCCNETIDPRKCKNGTDNVALVYNHSCFEDGFYNQTLHKTDGILKDYERTVYLPIISLFSLICEIVIFNVYYFTWPHIKGECPSIIFSDHFMINYV